MSRYLDGVDDLTDLAWTARQPRPRSYVGNERTTFETIAIGVGLAAAVATIINTCLLWRRQ